jgi:hypothetical protein
MDVLVIGASSGMARACIRLWASQGARLVLVGRDGEELARIAADAQLRGAPEAHPIVGDAGDLQQHEALLAQLRNTLPQGPQVTLLAYGTMADQQEAQADRALALGQIQVNYTSVVLLCEALVPHLPAAAVLAVISSVAGDRGRQSNYLYGSTKAGLTAYLQGLRNRLFHEGRHVLTIKPGFVATPMTAGLLKTGSPLVASPEQVAHDILRAIARRRNVLYTRWFWGWIMAIITRIPEALFKRLRL